MVINVLLLDKLVVMNLIFRHGNDVNKAKQSGILVVYDYITSRSAFVGEQQGQQKQFSIKEYVQVSYHCTYTFRYIS